MFKKKKKLFNYRSMSGFNPFISFNTEESFVTFTENNKPKKKPKDIRKKKKPIEIWEELIAEKPNIDCSDIDKKIKVVEKRIEVVESYMKDTPNDEYEVLGYLKARKKYAKYAEHLQYPITTQEIIDELCKKYKVEVRKFEEYYTLVPEEGIDELVEFKRICQKIRTEKPVVRLIVPITEKKEMSKRKRDPILLVSSPFGRWDYILGAWDKEVAIVDDFIYNGK